MAMKNTPKAALALALAAPLLACNIKASCTLEADDCPEGSVCYAPQTGSTKGICIPGEYNPQHLLMASIKVWRLLQNGVERFALMGDGIEGENANASWLNDGGFELYIRVDGPDAHKYVGATAGGAQAVCETLPQCQTLSCEWLCRFDDTWQTTSGKLIVRIEAGEGALKSTRTRNYRVSLSPPSAYMEINGQAVSADETLGVALGDVLHLCYVGIDAESGLFSVEAAQPPQATLLGPPPTPLPLEWTQSLKAVDRLCWTTPLPLTLTGEALLQGFVDVTNNARTINPQLSLETHLHLTRVGCRGGSVVASDSVTQPLVSTGEYVVFATSLGADTAAYNSLYFVDSNCGLRSFNNG
ncbi:MAG: hypothetical protein FWD46_08515, partial [Cystobacterineae bacterium]|nr:hypothetical protein [Cystobacterineae bacterium]